MEAIKLYEEGILRGDPEAMFARAGMYTLDEPPEKNVDLVASNVARSIYLCDQSMARGFKKAEQVRQKQHDYSHDVVEALVELLWDELLANKRPSFQHTMNILLDNREIIADRLVTIKSSTLIKVMSKGQIIAEILQGDEEPPFYPDHFHSKSSLQIVKERFNRLMASKLVPLSGNMSSSANLKSDLVESPLFQSSVVDSPASVAFFKALKKAWILAATYTDSESDSEEESSTSQITNS